MSFDHILKQIFSREELLKKPPVLLDIGASGRMNPKWASIAPYSICVAADADDREMGYSESLNTRFKKSYIVHAIVTDHDQGNIVFYFTRSPYCSSSLPPAEKKLEAWDFHSLFTVDSIKKIKAQSLRSILAELDLDYIDWFKTDSQGTDLRLFASLPENCYSLVLAAEFEPGIIDAYIGEDKLWQVLEYMDRSNFWMSEFTLHGPRRLSKAVMEKNELDVSRLCLRTSPGWGELTYLKKIDPAGWSTREYLLAWVFACIERQFGFAAEIAACAGERYPEAIFATMKEFACAMMQGNTIYKMFLRVIRYGLRKVERALRDC